MDGGGQLEFCLRGLYSPPPYMCTIDQHYQTLKDTHARFKLHPLSASHGCD